MIRKVVVATFALLLTVGCAKQYSPTTREVLARIDARERYAHAVIHARA